jgi:hypothetical protein
MAHCYSLHPNSQLPRNISDELGTGEYFVRLDSTRELTLANLSRIGIAHSEIECPRRPSNRAFMNLGGACERSSDGSFGYVCRRTGLGTGARVGRQRDFTRAIETLLLQSIQTPSPAPAPPPIERDEAMEDEVVGDGDDEVDEECALPRGTWRETCSEPIIDVSNDKSKESSCQQSRGSGSHSDRCIVTATCRKKDQRTTQGTCFVYGVDETIALENIDGKLQEKVVEEAFDPKPRLPRVASGLRCEAVLTDIDALCAGLDEAACASSVCEWNRFASGACELHRDLYTACDLPMFRE